MVGGLNRRMTGREYYTSAMQSHGLPGKIPTSFTTVGKPYFENIQYNSPIEIYDDNTVDEMVKIMNNPGTDIGLKTEARPAHPVPLNNGFNNGFDQPRTLEVNSNLGWTVRTCNKSFVKPNPSEKTVSWSSDM